MDFSCFGKGQHSVLLTFVENDFRYRKFAIKSDRLGRTRSGENFNILKIVQVHSQIQLLDLNCPGQGQNALILSFVENDFRNRKFAIK